MIVLREVTLRRGSKLLLDAASVQLDQQQSLRQIHTQA